MRITTILMMVLALGFTAPMFAQDTKKEDPKETKKEDAPAKEDEAAKDEGKDAQKREMTEAGKSLFEDVERVYKKYYELVLAKVKANEPYKADDVWADAVKESKNAKYKDMAEFSDTLYCTDASGYIDVIRSRAGQESVMPIGHNPMLEEVAHSLSGRGNGSSALADGFATCGLAVIDFDTPLADVAPGKGNLQLFMTPEDL